MSEAELEKCEHCGDVHPALQSCPAFDAVTLADVATVAIVLGADASRADIQALRSIRQKVGNRPHP